MKKLAIELVGAGLLILAVIALLRNAEASADEADRLRTQLLVAEAIADSFEVAIAEESKSFQDLLANHEELSEQFREQGVRLEAAEARQATLTTAVVTARAQLAGHAEVWPDRLEEPQDFTQDQLLRMAEKWGTWDGEFFWSASDSTFSLFMECREGGGPDRISFDCLSDVEVTPTIAFLHQVGPDGTLFVTAEARDPRVTLEIETLEWVPPPEDRKWFENPLIIGTGGLAVGVGVLALAGVF